MGQAQVVLPDGREVFIAGEHEDHYDPDFFIYNDVVVVDEDKQVTILGYPESDFPPTDFHTATLVGQDILLIGNLGYPADRDLDQTQVYRLDVQSWQMTPVQTTGAPPGWIHDHTAALCEEENAIIVTGGKICGERILENIDDYRLSLTDLVWSRLTERHWERWILERADGGRNNLWEIRTACWNREFGLTEELLDVPLAQLPAEIADELKLPQVSDEQMEKGADLLR